MQRTQRNFDRVQYGIGSCLTAAKRILLPVFVYFLISVFAELCFTVLLSFFEKHPGGAFLQFVRQNEGLLLMLAISLPALSVLYRMYRRDGLIFAAEPAGGKALPCLPYILLSGFCASVGLNILIQLSPLIRLFPAILEVNEELAGGSLPLSLLYVALVAPLMEELLLRGLVYRRCREFLGFLPSAFLSALLFGALHANMVQFLYAFLLGLVLAFLYERYGRLSAVVLFHAAGNLFGGLSAFILAACDEMGKPYLAAAAGILLLLLLFYACAKIGKSVPPRRWRKLNLSDASCQNDAEIS